MIESPVRASRLTAPFGYLGFILIGWNGVLVPSLIRSIEHDFQVNDAAFGLFYLLYSLMYASSSLLSGLLTERIGRRIVLPVAALSMAVGFAGEVLAPSWPAFVVAAWFVGAGAGGIDAGTNALILDLYREARGGALNLLHLFYSVGAFISPFVVGRLLGAGVVWRPIVIATAVAAVLFAIALTGVSMPSGRHQPAHMSSADTYTASESSLLPFAGLALGICFFVMAEQGVSGWLVKYLSSVSVGTATGVLSLFWLGLAAGRLSSRWLAEMVDYSAFTVAAMLLGAAALLGAVVVPTFAISAALFAVTGFFFGPVYPMIIALGGNIYPHRLSALAGSLGAASIVGSLTYPPLMGVMAGSVGLRAGMLGAAFVGIPSALGIAGATVAARRNRTATK